MCSSPQCPGGCVTLGRTGRERRQNMVRAYVKVYDNRKKQHTVPVGWWCPACRSFETDLA